jgi:hypothetical protein
VEEVAVLGEGGRDASRATDFRPLIYGRYRRQNAFVRHQNHKSSIERRAYDPLSFVG